MLSEGGQRTFIVVDGPNDTILVVGWTLVTLYGEEAQQMLANKSVKSETWDKEVTLQVKNEAGELKIGWLDYDGNLKETTDMGSAWN